MLILRDSDCSIINVLLDITAVDNNMKDIPTRVEFVLACKLHLNFSDFYFRNKKKKIKVLS